MAENSFEILRALPEHAVQLTQITIAAKRHWGYPEAWIQLWIPQLTVSAEYILENETWMAVVVDKPVAYHSLKLDGEGLWLDNLWVLPEYMGQGIGGSLFKHALKRGLACGAAVLKIEADPHAESFYAKMGARKIGEQDRGELDGLPRILPVMEINL